jgi:hypothetical protein
LIEAAFNSIREACKIPELLKFFVYYEAEWIQKVTPQNFAVHDLDDRSNNSTENHNFTLQRYTVKMDESLWEFLSMIKINHN